MKMSVTKIIACGDIHIRNLRRQDEYQEQLQKFIDECKKIVKENGKDETRIVILGDVFHNKLDISGEAYVLANWFLKQLDKICKTVVIAGNHDMNMANLSRIDPVTTLFGMSKYKQVYYLDKELDYESGILNDDNISWCLFSSFDSFTRPNIEETKLDYPNNTFIGLIHGDIKGSKTDVGFVSESGLDVKYFDNLDVCFCGHIHKRQELTYNGTKILYSGSLIQQDFGENLSGHGYIVWDVNDETYTTHDIDNSNNGFYTMSIDDINDIDNDLEKILNL